MAEMHDASSSQTPAESHIDSREDVASPGRSKQRRAKRIHWFDVVVWTVRVVAAVALLKVTVVFLTTDRFYPLAERMSLVTVASTVALVAITVVYVRITGKTLEHLREERLAAAEPLLYVNVKEMILDSDNCLEFAIHNFGKGPAISLRGECIRGREIESDRVVVSSIASVPSLLPVGVEQSFTIQLSKEDIVELATEGRRDSFVTLRLVYEDARRNLYVYRLSLTAITDGDLRLIQEYSEKVWRIPSHDRSYIFDGVNSSIALEYGRKPLFARSLEGFGFDPDE